MNDLVKRLRASVNLGAVRGNSFERGVCESQMSEAASVITAMQEEISALREHLTSHIKQIGGLERIINMQAARVAALEKVAKLVLFYGTGHMDIRVALREAGYLGGGE